MANPKIGAGGKYPDYPHIPHLSHRQSGHPRYFAAMLTVLLIGGYGTFGQRIVTRLASETGLHITIAGRNLSKAAQLCTEFEGAAITLSPLKFDRTQPISAQLDSQFDIIIDASGPFQNYVDEAVADYCIASGIAYFDLSDDRAFCARVMSKTSETPVVTGLSTYPVLTTVAAKAATEHFSVITKIEAGISPAPSTDMGRSVVGAVASKAGEPMRALEHGALKTVSAMTRTRHLRIAPPGGPIIGSVLFSRADTPETDALPRLFPKINDIWCGAGPRPRALHWLFILMAKFRAAKLLPNLGRFASLMHRVQNALPARDDRGGMCVYIHGEDMSGAPLTRSWHLVARGDSGPFIPALPAVILIQKALRDEVLPSGPHYGSDLLDLEDFENSFEELSITHGFRGASARDDSLYRHILGSAYDKLPTPLQELHDIGKGKTFSGTANITRGRNPLANIVANIFGFPKAGNNVPVTVSLTRHGNAEHWVRHFNGKRMFSSQEAGKGQDAFQIIERFGPVSARLNMLACDDGRLWLIPTAFRIFGIPMPKFLFPRGDMFENVKDGQFMFHVDIVAPFLGRLVKYEGNLTQIKTPPQNI